MRLITYRHEIQTSGDSGHCILPLEVQERILDFLAGFIEAGGRDALKACLLTCKAWTPRCRFHLLHEITLRGRSEVFAFSKLLSLNQHFRSRVVYVRIRTPTVSRGAEHLASFAARFSGRLPALYDLTICDAQLTLGTLHSDTFLHLSGFASLRHLSLSNVTFKARMMLYRTICALPGLALLQCTDVAIPEATRDLPRAVCPNRPKIHHLGIDGSAESLGRVIDLCVTASFTGTLRTIVLGHRSAVPLHTLCNPVQRLLNSAGPSLRTFSCVVDQHYFVEGQRGGLRSTSPTAEPPPLVPTAQHVNFVSNARLERVILRITVHSIISSLLWIPRLLSSITIDDRGELYVCFVVDAGVDDAPRILQALCEYLRQSTLLAEIQDIVLRPGFSKLQQIAVDIEVVHPIPLSAPLCTWSELVSSGMPQLQARGIVR